MSIKSVFTMQGNIIGDFNETLDGSYDVTNPVLVVPQGNGMGFMPLLGMMEERVLNLKPSDIMFGGIFTPVIEVRNQYNKMFGSGIIEAGSSLVT